jgi:hypothetical protein
MLKLQKPSWVSYALSILILACMNACENPLERLNPDKNQGFLNIEIGLEMKIFKSNARLQAVNTDDFLVVIKKANDEVYLSYNRAVDVPSDIPVNPGDYYIEVESPNDVNPAFDNPKYFGRSEVFSIAPNELKSVPVSASLANCMVSVIYSQNVIDQFTDFYTVVSNSNGSVTFASDETRMGYFDLIPITIESHLSFILGDGSIDTKIISGEIPLPEAGTHYEVHIDSSLDQGSMSINLLVDESFLVEIIDVNDQGTTINDGAIAYGDLLITEIMYNPSALSDTEGEWFEIYNASNQSIDIFELVIKQGSVVQHVVNEHILLEPQQYLALGRSLSASTGIGYVYGSDLTLTNTEDEIELANYGTDGTDGQSISIVNYGIAGFPDGTGASLNLDLNAFDADLAQSGENWCTSTAVFDTGDLGSPGSTNEVCNQ